MGEDSRCQASRAQGFKKVKGWEELLNTFLSITIRLELLYLERLVGFFQTVRKVP